MSQRPLRLAFVGFGNVGRRFAELLPGPYARVLREAGVTATITGVATGRHGIAIDERGLDPADLLRLLRKDGDLGALHVDGRRPADSAAFVRRVPADVLVEISPLDPHHGEPATTHARLALRRGLHVVTANKGPVAFARRSLARLAARRGVLFLHEGAVMDGTPIFNLVERCLPGVGVTGFRGVLNSTTTRILSRMEEGVSARAALREAQEAGVAERDPTHDLEGWDAAVKGCAIANAIMDADVTPRQVKRRGITGITLADVRAARRAGTRLRLLVRGRRRGRRVLVSVAPERIPDGDLLASTGADGILVLETEQMGEIGIWEGPLGVTQTAYALLADLVRVAATRTGGA
jgi:homoserine dehydrogenase